MLEGDGFELSVSGKSDVDFPGSTVKVTLEIEAEVEPGTPENVVRTVTENSRTLKFNIHVRGGVGPRFRRETIPGRFYTSCSNKPIMHGTQLLIA
jgi:hypothetical protein